MSERVIEIAKAMGKSEIEKKLAFSCSPLILGLKCANMIYTSDENISKIQRIFDNSPVTVRVIYSSKGSSLIFLFRRDMLKKALNMPSVFDLLCGCGYDPGDVDSAVTVLSKRIVASRDCGEEFPHEVGVFLGYPAEDVIGFMENEGHNELITGYWKVYKRPAEKSMLFRKFDRAREIVLPLADKGVSLRNIALRPASVIADCHTSF